MLTNKHCNYILQLDTVNSLDHLISIHPGGSLHLIYTGNLKKSVFSLLLTDNLLSSVWSSNSYFGRLSASAIIWYLWISTHWTSRSRCREKLLWQITRFRQNITVASNNHTTNYLTYYRVNRKPQSTTAHFEELCVFHQVPTVPNGIRTRFILGPL